MKITIPTILLSDNIDVIARTNNITSLSKIKIQALIHALHCLEHPEQLIDEETKSAVRERLSNQPLEDISFQDLKACTDLLKASQAGSQTFRRLSHHTHETLGLATNQSQAINLSELQNFGACPSETMVSLAYKYLPMIEDYVKRGQAELQACNVEPYSNELRAYGTFLETLSKQIKLYQKKLAKAMQFRLKSFDQHFDIEWDHTLSDHASHDSYQTTRREHGIEPEALIRSFDKKHLIPFHNYIEKHGAQATKAEFKALSWIENGTIKQTKKGIWQFSRRDTLEKGTIPLKERRPKFLFKGHNARIRAFANLPHQVNISLTMSCVKRFEKTHLQSHSSRQHNKIINCFNNLVKEEKRLNDIQNSLNRFIHRSTRNMIARQKNRLSSSRNTIIQSLCNQVTSMVHQYRDTGDENLFDKVLRYKDNIDQMMTYSRSRLLDRKHSDMIELVNDMESRRNATQPIDIQIKRTRHRGRFTVDATHAISLILYTIHHDDLEAVESLLNVYNQQFIDEAEKELLIPLIDSIQAIYFTKERIFDREEFNTLLDILRILPNTESVARLIRICENPVIPQLIPSQLIYELTSSVINQIVELPSLQHYYDHLFLGIVPEEKQDQVNNIVEQLLETPKILECLNEIVSDNSQSNSTHQETSNFTPNLNKLISAINQLKPKSKKSIKAKKTETNSQESIQTLQAPRGALITDIQNEDIQGALETMGRYSDQQIAYSLTKYMRYLIASINSGNDAYDQLYTIEKIANAYEFSESLSEIKILCQNAQNIQLECVSSISELTNRLEDNPQELVVPELLPLIMKHKLTTSIDIYEMIQTLIKTHISKNAGLLNLNTFNSLLACLEHSDSTGLYSSILELNKDIMTFLDAQDFDNCIILLRAFDQQRIPFGQSGIFLPLIMHIQKTYFTDENLTHKEGFNKLANVLECFPPCFESARLIRVCNYAMFPSIIASQLMVEINDCVSGKNNSLPSLQCFYDYLSLGAISTDRIHYLQHHINQILDSDKIDLTLEAESLLHEVLSATMKEDHTSANHGPSLSTEIPDTVSSSGPSMESLTIPEDQLIRQFLNDDKKSALETMSTYTDEQISDSLIKYIKYLVSSIRFNHDPFEKLQEIEGIANDSRFTDELSEIQTLCLNAEDIPEASIFTLAKLSNHLDEEPQNLVVSKLLPLVMKYKLTTSDESFQILESLINAHLEKNSETLNAETLEILKACAPCLSSSSNIEEENSTDVCITASQPTP